MLNTILVALDQPEMADQVIQMLYQLQIQAVTKVVLLHVIVPAGPEVDIAVDRPQQREAGSYHQIEAWLQSYQTQLPCTSHIEIVTGDPVEEILRLTNIYRADLILIGSRGLIGMERILSGSVSSQVASDAPCSVLVVKPR